MSKELKIDGVTDCPTCGGPVWNYRPQPDTNKFKPDYPANFPDAIEMLQTMHDEDKADGLFVSGYRMALRVGINFLKVLRDNQPDTSKPSTKIGDMMIPVDENVVFGKGKPDTSEAAKFDPDYIMLMEERDKLTAEIKALRDPWVSVEDGLPKHRQKVIAEIEHFHTHGKKYAVLFKVDESDCSWRTADDNSEIAYEWNVKKWMPIPEPRKDGK